MKKYMKFPSGMRGLHDTQQEAESEAADRAFELGRDYVVAEVTIVKVAHSIRNIEIQDPDDD